MDNKYNKLAIIGLFSIVFVFILIQPVLAQSLAQAQPIDFKLDKNQSIDFNLVDTDQPPPDYFYHRLIAWAGSFLTIVILIPLVEFLIIYLLFLKRIIIKSFFKLFMLILAANLITTPIIIASWIYLTLHMLELVSFHRKDFLELCSFSAILLFAMILPTILEFYIFKWFFNIFNKHKYFTELIDNKKIFKIIITISIITFFIGFSFLFYISDYRLRLF